MSVINLRGTNKKVQTDKMAEIETVLKEAVEKIKALVPEEPEVHHAMFFAFPKSDLGTFHISASEKYIMEFVLSIIDNSATIKNFVEHYILLGKTEGKMQ